MQSLKQLHNIDLQTPKGLKKKKTAKKSRTKTIQLKQRSLFNKKYMGMGSAMVG